MAKNDQIKQRCVAGHVKARSNKDNSITFTVAGKNGQKFTLSAVSDHAEMLLSAKRALVGYEEGGRNPKVVFVLANPSCRLIREHMAHT